MRSRVWRSVLAAEDGRHLDTTCPDEVVAEAGKAEQEVDGGGVKGGRHL